MIKKFVLLVLILMPGFASAQIGPWTFTMTPTKTATVDVSWTPGGGNQYTPTPTPTTIPTYVPGLDLENTQLQILAKLKSGIVIVTMTATITPTPTKTFTPNLTNTITFTPTFTFTSTNTPQAVNVIPVVTVVNEGSYSVNPASSATPAVVATAIPSATPYFHKVVVTYNNPGTAGGGIGLWAPTKIGGADVIAPSGGMGQGSGSFVILYGPGQPLSISGPNCTLGASAGATITGFIWDYLSLTPFSQVAP